MFRRHNKTWPLKAWIRELLGRVRDRPDKWKWFLLSVVGLTSLLLVLLGLAAIHGEKELRRLKTIEREAQIQYSRMNNEHEFDPVTTYSRIANNRWTTAWEIRKSVYSRLDPRLSVKMQAWLQANLGDDGPGIMGLVCSLTSVADMIDILIDEHLQQLEKDAMSPKEYYWLLGRAIHAALRDPDRHTAGLEYHELIERYNRAAKNDQIPIMKSMQLPVLVVEDIIGLLEPRFRGFASPPDDMISGLEHPDSLAYMLDLVTAGLQFE